VRLAWVIAQLAIEHNRNGKNQPVAHHRLRGDDSAGYHDGAEHIDFAEYIDFAEHIDFAEPAPAHRDEFTGLQAARTASLSGGTGARNLWRQLMEPHRPATG
jgi:hypothetical protein